MAAIVAPPKDGLNRIIYTDSARVSIWSYSGVPGGANSTQEYSYAQYDQLRVEDPTLPSVQEDAAGMVEGASLDKSGLNKPPVAVSLTPNVTNARVYSLAMMQPRPNPPESAKEYANHAAGIAMGALQTVGEGLLATANLLNDSILQVGDLLTAGLFREADVMQGVWQRQNDRGEAIIQVAKNPVDTATGMIDALQDKQRQAEALRAAGDFYEAGKITGSVLADINPTAGAVGMVKKLPDGMPIPPARKGLDGVVIIKNKYDANDFISQHAYDRHKYDPDKPSTKNRTRYSSDANPNEIRKATIEYPDSIEKLYDKDGVHYATRYSKDMGYNISQSPIETSQSRVFINHRDPGSSTQFPYGR